MTEKKPLNEGHQPEKRGYQPTSTPPAPDVGKVQGGYQPPTSEAKPKPDPPPKKP
jgi:hypothetical protein